MNRSRYHYFGHLSRPEIEALGGKSGAENFNKRRLKWTAANVPRRRPETDYWPAKRELADRRQRDRPAGRPIIIYSAPQADCSGPET